MAWEQEVFALTDRGSAQLRDAGTARTRTELEILVLVDGRATVAQITHTARNLSATAVGEILRTLASDGLIKPARELQSDAIDVGDFFSISVPERSGAASEVADTEASHRISSLRQHGYYVSFSRRGAERELRPGQRLAVVVIEDEPHVAKLLRTYFTMEGFAARTAANRTEILAAFREPPLPDLVLLDVALPDADGFDVLAKMRQHPQLKSVPVIMLTAQATRESVIKGILGGADGYITKPFNVDTLVKAAYAVLGLDPTTRDKRKSV
jgi:two-component system OmpR family response regulator